MKVQRPRADYNRLDVRCFDRRNDLSEIVLITFNRNVLERIQQSRLRRKTQSGNVSTIGPIVIGS